MIVDGLFGFSFKPPVSSYIYYDETLHEVCFKVREAFCGVINLMLVANIPIVSIDIPSGWNVEKGPEDVNNIQPSMLISLTGK